MREHRLKKPLALILSIMLMATLMVVPVSASENTKETLEPQSLGTVSIRDNVNVDINNVVMIPSDEGQLVGFTVSVHNNSNAELNFIDYWIELHSKAGAIFTVNAVNKDVNTIAAKSTKDIIFYGQVGADLKISDLVVKVIKWDFNRDNFVQVLGEVAVPANYNPVSVGTTSRIISAENTRLAIGINRATIGESEKYFRPDIEITIQNVGKRSLTLPNYEIAILTNDGLLYPLTSRRLGSTPISPLAEEEFRLTASIPNDVDPTEWKLAVILPVNEGASSVPLALFDLPEERVEQANDIGKYYTFTTTDGIYNVRVDSMNRIPIEDNDLIVSNLTIMNPGDESVPMPVLAGEYTFNDSIEQSVAVSANDKIISLAPEQTVQVQAVGTVPYTLEITDVDLTIQQQDTEEDNELINLVEFSNEGIFDAVPVVQSNESYAITDLGYRGNVSVRKAMTFSGNNANIIAVQINVESQESRLTTVQKMAGYFENAEGVIYQANVQEIENKLSPKGNAAFFAWATVPKAENLNEMQLVIGKAVEELQSNSEEAKLVGYVNPIQYELPSEYEAQQNLQEIDLYPYNLSITKIGTQIQYGEHRVVLDLDYKLEKDMLAETNLGNQKVIVEISDNSKKAEFEKIFTLSDVKDESSAETLEIGEESLEISWIDPDLIYDIQTLKEFDLNIYLELEPGYKKLVATQKLPWFVNRDLGEK